MPKGNVPKIGNLERVPIVITQCIVDFAQKKAECGRMSMEPHSLTYMRTPCLVSGGNIPAGLRLKGGNRRFPTECVRARSASDDRWR